MTKGSETAFLSDRPWQWWRDQMPVTQEYAYFDHAAVAPLTRPAAEAIARIVAESASGGDTLWPQWSAQLSKLRASTAEMLNCDVAEICLIPNTTTGINLIAEGWAWQPGDNVILPEHEFPSNLFPWLNQQSRGVEVRLVPRHGESGGGGEVRVDDLIARIDDSTRMIALSWVGYASGYRVDVDRLVREAHRRGVLVFLDAIQGLGMYPLDLAETPVDFLAADGHKWLLGPEGAGVAMVRKEHLSKIRCGNVGWASVKNSHNYTDPKLQLRDDAIRFESGSGNMLGGAGMAASMQMFLTVRRHLGSDAIANRVIDLVEQLDRELRALGGITTMPSDRQHRSGILNFNLPNVRPDDFRQRALREKVVVSCRGGGIRASVHVYNDSSDIDRLIDVAKSFL